VYLKNCSPTKSVPEMTPQEAWSGYKPTVRHLRTFGCKAYAHVLKSKRGQFDSKAVECIFVGYCSRTKGYRLYNPSTKRVFISRDVIFDESNDQNHSEKGESFSEIEEHEEIEVPADIDTLKDDESDEEKDLETEDVDDDHDDQDTLDQQEHSQIPSSSNFQGVLIPKHSTRDRKPPERYGFDAEQARVAFSLEEPQSYKEALEQNDSKEWEKAMKNEY